MRQSFFFEGQVTKKTGTRRDRARPFVYLPFTVPPRTVRLEVSYHFEHPLEGDLGAGGGNALDLGIFDPRGTDFLTGGFRGWSGRARWNFYITPTSATPGYLPGPLTPGRWNVCLGAAELEDPSCRYWLNVDLDVLTEDQQPQDVEASFGLHERLPAAPDPQPVSGAGGGSPGPAAAGTAATSIATPSTATASTPSRSWQPMPASAASTSWPSPTTTLAATTPR